MTSAYDDDIRATSLEVYVATHKPIDFALPDYCRKIQVNAEANGQWPGYLHDNDNPDNISRKNPNYSELTALYSMWKNCEADIQGLYHYRRYMVGHITDSFYETTQLAEITEDEILSSCATQDEITAALRDSDVILTYPAPRYPLNCLEAIVIAGKSASSRHKYIDAMRKVIRDFWPDYLPSLCEVLDGDSMSIYNMFIARRDFVDGYCSWLFDVLGKVENLISCYKNEEGYARIYGYLSEFLLNVYVRRNSLRTSYFSRSLVKEENRIKHALKKIPLLRKAVRAAKKIIRDYRKETRKSGKFTANIFTFKPVVYPALFIAELEPDVSCDILPALSETLPALRLEAEQKNLVFVPRIRLSGEISESLRESLSNLGVRILQN